MKKKRSLCAALLAGLMVTAVCLTGCGKKADDNAGGGSSDPGKVYQVGVCQLTQHDALDAATQGFVDALNTILGSEHVNIDVQVASGDSTTCTPIVNSFVNKKVDLIMANATPALQAAYNATTSIPILGTSVTEYGGKVYQVGVCQLTQHDALDAATQGFVDALNTILGSEHVNIDVQVASGDSTTCTPIVNSFVNKKVDLIMANATPALQAAYNATTSIPILGTSVTEYGVALGLSDFSGTVGGNISGTSDLAPLTEQADMILELVPQAKTVGLLYCSAEPNSEYQVKVVEDYLSGKGITCTRYSFSDSNDVAAVTTKAAADSDVIYIPTDNTAASCTETIGSIVRSAKTPVVAGEQGICVGCGIATLSISYYDLGYKTGEMAAQILKGEADISQMPIEYANASKLYNADMCQELGITVPEGYTALEG